MKPVCCVNKESPGNAMDILRAGEFYLLLCRHNLAERAISVFSSSAKIKKKAAIAAFR